MGRQPQMLFLSSRQYVMRAFIAAAFTFAAVINFGMWYRPAEAVPVPVKVASWLKTDKVQDRLPVPAVKTIKYRLDPPVAALNTMPDRVGLPWSCATIRNAVA